MSKALLKNILHILEALVVGYALFTLLGLSCYLIGGAILLVMWAICYVGLTIFRTQVVNKTVKNKTGVEVNSTKKQWLIGMLTCLFGYLLGGVLFYIIGGVA